MLIQGKCHCGNISFSLTWEPDPDEIPARACTCSFCVKHGGLWTSNPRGALEVAVQDRAAVSTYGFGTRTAEFHEACRRHSLLVGKGGLYGNVIRLAPMLNVTAGELDEGIAASYQFMHGLGLES